jgi:hypothetical protein
MTPTDLKLQKIQKAEAARREMRRAIAVERKCSQWSGFIMVLAQALDDWIPFGLASAIGRAILRRRIGRRQQATG